MPVTSDIAAPIVRGSAPKTLGPDMMSIGQLHRALGMDESFNAEFTILSPHLRKITKSWIDEIPMMIVQDESAQDNMTIRDLNGINAHVKLYMEAMYSGRFYEEFEYPLDGIALILRAHGINPGWATMAFSSSFDSAQQKLFFETRQANSRVFPAALRCLMKILILTVHLLNRRDHELNDITPQKGKRASQAG